MSEPGPKPPPQATQKRDDDDRLYGGFYEHSTAGQMPRAPPAPKPSPKAPGPAPAAGAKQAQGGSALARFFRALFGR